MLPAKGDEEKRHPCDLKRPPNPRAEEADDIRDPFHTEGRGKLNGFRMITGPWPPSFEDIIKIWATCLLTGRLGGRHLGEE